MRSVCLFVLYLYACTRIVLRSCTRSGDRVYRRVLKKECLHLWKLTDSVTKKRTSVYANCERCGATR